MKLYKVSISALVVAVAFVSYACSPFAQQVEVYSTSNPEEDLSSGDSFFNDVINSIGVKDQNKVLPPQPVSEKETPKNDVKDMKPVVEAKTATSNISSEVSEEYPRCTKDKGYYKIGDAYQIDGVWYYPREDYQYKEEGIASWYGPAFHGKATANGEKFDTLTMTAAHKTLPLPSIVKVTNLENGISVVLKVNDRGPFVKDRVIDLSQKAAEILDMKEKGSALVRVEVLEQESKEAKERALKCQSTDLKHDIVSKNENDIKKLDDIKPVDIVMPEPVKPQDTVKSVEPVKPMPAMSPVLNDEYPYYVQVGAFVSETGANKVQQLLKDNGIDAKVSKKITSGENWYKVRIGSFKTREDAMDVQRRVNKIVEDTDARVIERTEDDTNSFKWMR